MNCEEVLTQLEQLVDGELAPPAKGQVQVHLSRCPRCASTLQTMLREQADLEAGLTFEELPEAKRQALERRTLRAIEEAEGGGRPCPLREAGRSRPSSSCRWPPVWWRSPP